MLPEAFLFVIGIIASLVVTAIKALFAVTAFGWLACWIPLLIAVVIICFINGIDFWD